MEVLQTQNKAGQDESDGFLSQTLEHLNSGGAIADQGVGITGLGPFHNDVEVVLISKGIEQSGDKITRRFL